MARKRVHEIAKERGITSKQALEVLQKAGLEVKVAASSVEEEEAAKAFGNGAEATGDAAPAADAQAGSSEKAPARKGGRRQDGGDGQGSRRSAGPPQPRPDIRPADGEPVRRAGPEGRGPRILQDAPPPQERQPQRPAAGRGGPRGDGGAREAGSGSGSVKVPRATRAAAPVAARGPRAAVEARAVAAVAAEAVAGEW